MPLQQISHATHDSVDHSFRILNSSFIWQRFNCFSDIPMARVLKWAICASSSCDTPTALSSPLYLSLLKMVQDVATDLHDLKVFDHTGVRRILRVHWTDSVSNDAVRTRCKLARLERHTTHPTTTLVWVCRPMPRLSADPQNNGQRRKSKCIVLVNKEHQPRFPVSKRLSNPTVI